MKNVIRNLVCAGVLGASTLGFAAGDEAAVEPSKGTAQLKEATASAVTLFNEKVGAEAAKNVGLVTLTKGDDSIVVAITYKEGEATKTATFDCKGAKVACEQPATGDATVAVTVRANAKWGLAELKTSTDFALDKFKASQAADDEKVETVSVKKNIQGNAAKVLIGFGAEEPTEYFCHNHGDHIDCH